VFVVQAANTKINAKDNTFNSECLWFAMFFRIFRAKALSVFYFRIYNALHTDNA
jgi:hypothetical protein